MATQLMDVAAPSADHNTDRTYTIDVWDGESIWSWDGVASSQQEAEQAAVEQLNEDWDRNYADYEEMEADVDGAALMMHPAVMAERQPQATVDAAKALVTLVRGLVDNGALDRLGTSDGLPQADRDALKHYLAILA